MIKIKRYLAIILSVVMVLTIAPTTALADVGIQSGAGTITPNIGGGTATPTGTTVGFAGHLWWVIGDGSTGVNPLANNATLLHHQECTCVGFGRPAFRIGQEETPSPTTGWKQYSGNGVWYQGSFTQPNDYNDSTLMRAMTTATSALPAKEALLITTRTLDNIGGAEVSGQSLWPLSFGESIDIANDTVLSYEHWYWLRTPGSTLYAVFGGPEGQTAITEVFHSYICVRPALSLNLSSVIFTSAASGAGSKSVATVGSGLISTSAPTGAVKFTVEDSSLQLRSVSPTKVNGRTITFNYTGATAGKTLSAMLLGADGAVKYYGKLANNSSSSGTASVAIPNGFSATDSLRIFIEECNGDNLTDFASPLIDLPVDIQAISEPDKTNLSKVKITIADTVWTGKQLKPTKFIYNGKSYDINSNATVNKYGANKKIGKGTIKITGKGNFTGSKSITFKIVPKSNKISKITASKKQMKVKWRKASKAQKITKYQVRYRIKGTTKWKTKTYKASASTATIKGLKKNKKYQVQVRSYKSVSKVKYYSKWSATKTSKKIK